MKGRVLHVLGASLLAFLHSTNQKLLGLAQGEAVIPVHVVGMQLDIYRIPYDSVYASGFMARILVICC